VQDAKLCWKSACMIQHPNRLISRAKKAPRVCSPLRSSRPCVLFASYQCLLDQDSSSSPLVTEAILILDGRSLVGLLATWVVFSQSFCPSRIHLALHPLRAKQWGGVGWGGGLPLPFPLPLQTKPEGATLVSCPRPVTAETKHYPCYARLM